MSVEDIAGTSKDRGVKTLAIRLEPDQHAQLSLIAQLRGSTIGDELKAAVVAHIESIRNQPELAARADAVRQAIEREAVLRREAIASLFAVGGSESAEPAPTGSPSRKGKSD